MPVVNGMLLPDIPGRMQQGRQYAQQNQLQNMKLGQMGKAIEREDKLRSTMGELGATEPGNRAYLARLAQQGPEGLKMAESVSKMWDDFSEQDRQVFQKQLQESSKMLTLAKDPETYQIARQQAIEANPRLEGVLPKEWSPETATVVEGQINRVRTIEDILKQKQGAQAAGVQSSKILPDGSVVNVMSDGRRQVLGPQGSPLMGQDAADAIQEAQEFGVELQGERAGTRTRRTLEERTELEPDLDEAKAFAKLTGSSRAKAIDSADENIRKLETNIRNLDEAYQALDDGAKSGAIVSRYTPTLREETQRLENVRNKLGLDVIGSVTFGALSKPELDMALATALPPLPPEDLKKWIRDQQAAKRKLISYFDQQIEHLDNGGTVASFRRMMRRGTGQGNTTQQQTGSGGQPSETDDIDSLVNQYAD